MKWSDKPPKRPLWTMDEPLTRGQKRSLLGRLLWGLILALLLVAVLATISILAYEVANSWIWEWLRCL